MFASTTQRVEMDASGHMRCVTTDQMMAKVAHLDAWESLKAGIVLMSFSKTHNVWKFRIMGRSQDLKSVMTEMKSLGMDAPRRCSLRKDGCALESLLFANLSVEMGSDSSWRHVMMEMLKTMMDAALIALQ